MRGGGKENLKYDLIYLSHVLEHIVDPYHFLESLKEINNQFIFIEVPTFDYKLQDEPYGMFGEEHVNYFTYESLYSMMYRLGYRHIDAQIEFSFDSGFPAGFPSIVTLWEKSEYNHKMKPIKPIVSTRILFEAYIKKSEMLEALNRKIIDKILPSAKLAVWGTGHHTSRLLATTSLGEKNIVKFYDSDERKHSYRIMDRAITRFDKSDIEKGEVDTILISSYVAQASISKMIIDSGIKANTISLYVI